MDITTEVEALFDSPLQRTKTMLLLDITIIVNPYVSSSLENAARHARKHLADVVERKISKHRDSFFAPYSVVSLAMSTWGDSGSYLH